MKLYIYFLFSFIFLNSFPLYSQQYDAQSSLNYEELREKYMSFAENDVLAFKYLQPFIQKAKKEQNYAQLSRGYLDAINFTGNDKIIYADSAIHAAKLTSKNDVIARAYMFKGSTYYFNQKKYQKALNEYIKAYKYAEKIQDHYLKNKIEYHLAIVKGYLGYNEEAIELLDNCIQYFENEYKDNTHSNIKFNNQKGYLNSIHQSINFNYNLNNLSRVDSLINVGLSHTPSTDEFQLEQSYFYKWKGIQLYNQKKYVDALYYLKKSLYGLKDTNDFAQIAVIHYYIGNSLIESGNKELGYNFLNKIDSNFNKNNFLLPELRKSYEILITHYRQTNNLEKQLYYTNQLLKADEYFMSDFRYLSQKISKEYDTHNLRREKESLVSQNKWSSNALIISIGLIVALLVSLFLQYRKNKKIKENYIKLIQKLEEGSHVVQLKPATKPVSNSIQGSELAKEILQKLAFFETNEKFLASDLTQAKLASMLKTNTAYLSQIINENKGMNFNQYINTLRINYITRLLYQDKVYLNHSIEALAEKAGFSSRQVFSNVFYKINNIRPKDFIENRKKELKEEQVPATALL